MNKAMKALSPDQEIASRIVIALDVDRREAALSIAEELAGRGVAFKIGLQLFTAEGPALVREMVELGHKIFLDLKFHDIPNTVAAASVGAARLGVWMFNIHTLGGAEMMRRTVADVNEACSRDNLARPLIIGVTMLTSADRQSMKAAGIEGEVEDQVVRLGRLAAESGLDGVVASPHEVAAIKKSVDRDGFLAVIPGIRAQNATGDDQKRVTTIREALANGSDYVVIGRPVTRSDDRLAALELLISDAKGSSDQ